MEDKSKPPTPCLSPSLQSNIGKVGYFKDLTEAIQGFIKVKELRNVILAIINEYFENAKASIQNTFELYIDNAKIDYTTFKSSKPTSIKDTVAQCFERVLSEVREMLSEIMHIVCEAWRGELRFLSKRRLNGGFTKKVG